MKLIVGLGNPGKQYENTRHNVGFKAMDFLVKHFELGTFKLQEKFKAHVLEGSIGGEKLIFAKPVTFMNLSGESVQLLSSFYKIAPADVMVLYDEVALPFGTLRVRKDGSSAGHNGVKSLIQSLGTDAFVRVRIGIEPLTPFRGELSDYVLGKLTDEELKKLETVIAELPEVLRGLITN
ncbi:aminoacyl-tRNA hydrolase [Candidatus Peregrinibacteria bacterium]|nr:MAG: aminoacyl-tRNA hydrolase [Candidatus Peregrinibacteria bacterium]